MEFRLGRLTINSIVILSVLLANIYSCALSGDKIVNESGSRMNSGYLTVKKEQIFWNKWINDNDKLTCPLSPFLLSFTQSKIEVFDRQIARLGVFEESVLFVRVNIDNGVLQAYYLAWNHDDDLPLFVKMNNINDDIIGGKIDVDTSVFDRLLLSSGNRNVVTDIHGASVLDADSLYLTLYSGGEFIRYASYNPPINTQNQESIPFQFVDYLMKN